jgi:hypothetical protein
MASRRIGHHFADPGECVVRREHIGYPHAIYPSYIGYNGLAVLWSSPFHPSSGRRDLLVATRSEASAALLGSSVWLS